MGTLSFFLQVYDDAPDYDVLNKLICAWRDVEYQTRTQCGLGPITSDYPGCISYMNDGDTTTTTQGTARNLRFPFVATAEEAEELLRDSIPYVKESPPPPPRAVSAYDIIVQNQFSLASNASYEPLKIGLDPDYHIVDPNSFDWDSFIAEQYAKDAEKKQYSNGRDHHGRELMNYDHVDWFNYFGMLEVRTEYYFRYSGTQTIPPCHGRFKQGQSRTNTNHWRVMKDPIRISARQLLELHRLLRDRIAPMDDPINACQPDTAGVVDTDTGLINVARPQQQNSKPHYTVFCECRNWVSKWQEDLDWCLTSDDQVTRFYTQPYNFPSNEF
jgi:Eukaryotic-type carbonic anhydrase